MDPNVWVAPCIEANLSNLTLTTKCIKKSASSLLSVSEHAELIAKIWLQNFETASEPVTQLALFYVLNEVLQNCTSYGAPEIKTTFKNPIMAALKSFRPGMPVDKVKKLLLMWGQQDLFEKEFSKRLLKYVRHFDRRLVQNLSKSNAEDFKDFSPDKLIRQLREYAEIETNSKNSEPELLSSCLDIPIETSLARIKSRADGVSFSKDVRNCADQLDCTLNDLSRKLAAQEALVRNIDKAMLFYLAQEKDARNVVNAYKLYEQQIRETLRSVGGSYTSTAKAGAADDTEYSCQNIYEDGGGGDSDMSDVEEIDNIPLHRPRLEPVASAGSMSDLLVDPKTLSDLPFSEYISVDDRGDVDYRLMFSKILENNSNRSEEIDSPQVIQTETGDFDYRKPPPPPPAVTDEDQKKRQPADPFGFGTHEDADLRELKPPDFERPPNHPSPIPEIPSDSDYRQLRPPQLQPVRIPSTYSYPRLNTDSDLRQSSGVPGNTVVSAPPVTVTNTVTSSHTLSPFIATLPPPPPSQLSTPVRPQVTNMPPPFQTTIPPPPSSFQRTTMFDHYIQPSPHTYQVQKQQNLPASSQIPSMSEAVLSALQRAPSSQPQSVTTTQPSQQPVCQSSSSTQPVTNQSQYTFANQVVTTVASSNVEDNSENTRPLEDPFSIIFRITGLSDLIKSAKSGKSVTGGNSPATPVTPRVDTTSTPTYQEGVKEVEKKAAAEKLTTQASNSSSGNTPHQLATTAQRVDADGDQSDGGATPTQDESENPNDAPPVINCFAFSQTGQMSFPPPPPLQTTATLSNNLLINNPPMNLPHTFLPMSQPPWHTGLPPGLGNLGGGGPPPHPTFFPAFHQSMLSRPPNFSSPPKSQSNQ